jgi:ubiquinone biosynthesis protein COQ4
MDTPAYPTLPANASFFTRIRLGLRALMVLKDDPANTYYGPLVNVCLDSGTYARLARVWRDDPDKRRLLDERPTLQGPDLDLGALARMPAGSLGRALAQYFRDNGLEPFVTAFPVRSDVDYLGKRYRETHDIFHVLTGYGVDEAGEMELQAFVLGNLGLRQTLLILGFSLPRRLWFKGVRGLGGHLGRLRAAYRRGKRAPELLSVRFEDLWAQPVTQLGARLCGPA